MYLTPASATNFRSFKVQNLIRWDSKVQVVSFDPRQVTKSRPNRKRIGVGSYNKVTCFKNLVLQQGKKA